MLLNPQLTSNIPPPDRFVAVCGAVYWGWQPWILWDRLGLGTPGVLWGCSRGSALQRLEGLCDFVGILWRWGIQEMGGEWTGRGEEFS